MKTIRRSLSFSFVTAAALLAGGASCLVGGAIAATGSSTASASKAKIAIVFQEDFDDDELGAVPLGTESEGSVTIHNSFGSVEGVKSGAATLLSVVREDASDIGNCLAIGDLDPASGGALAAFVPARGMVGATLGVRFTLRRESTSTSSELYLCAIDNRTTPGTGRLLAFGFTGIDGNLEIAGKPQPFALKNGASYLVELAIDLKVKEVDSWGLEIKNLQDPLDRYSVKDLRTLMNGEALSAIVVSASSDEGLFAYIDDLEISQYLEG